MSGQIHRRKKNKDFVILDTHCLRNPALKWDAKGLHSYLMQLPDDWKINISDLTNRSKDGTEGTSTPMNALIKAGYVKRIKVLGERGRFAGYDYEVFEHPQAQEVQPEPQPEIDTTVTGFSVHGKTVNGESVNGKPGTNKDEESKDEGYIYKAHTQENELPPPKSPKIETADEARTAINAWLNDGNEETVKLWYSELKINYDRGEFKTVLIKFCSNYMTSSDEGFVQRFQKDPVKFFRNRFQIFLPTCRGFDVKQSTKSAPSQNGAVYTPPAKRF